MADYKEMYLTLFRAVTQTIMLLQQAQQESEEIYISADESALTLLRGLKNNNDEDEK